MAGKEEPFVPDPEDLRIWEEYIRPKPSPVIPRSKYRRKRRRKRQGYERSRVSPTVRGYRSVMVKRETYEMLFEMKIFYKQSFTKMLHKLVLIAYDKTYKQAELLARIEQNREKNSASPYIDKPGR